MSGLSNFKRVLLGKPIATKHAHDERLSNVLGLAVFASDALSSVAYATEEVLLILVLAGTAAYGGLSGIAVGLCVLLGIIVVSYYQTIHAYPEGGGSYSVSKANLGPTAGKIAGAALLLDYVLTVSVSVASGVSALTSAVPAIEHVKVPIALFVVVFIMYLNLRGAKESGIVFAIPTYAFIISTLVLVVTGVVSGFGHPATTPVIHQPPGGWHELNLFLILRAFAASCTAMTGVEAVANGTQAFRKPEADNASKTLFRLAILLSVMFVGMSWSAQHFGVVPMEADKSGYMTVMAQLASRLYGAGSVGFWVTQITTFSILFLAANTAFAGFPRLASLLAQDGYLPRSLMSLGDKLVFNNGIIVLAGLSCVLITAFGADTHALIPLYAVGVFTAFTLSQAGMVARWRRQGKAGLPMAVNLVGAAATGLMTIVLAATKFVEGAWVTIFAILGVILFFNWSSKHYHYLASELSVDADDTLPNVKTMVMLLVPRMHKGILQAVAYAKSLSKDVRAVHVTLDPKGVKQVKDDWQRFGADIPLVILESPYRSLVEPLVEYVDETLEIEPTMMVTVIVPQAVPKYPWHKILHNNAAVPFLRALGGRKNVVVTNVRYFLK
ncbi:MAG: APC family permease [Fimbriimonadaceae bacterium]|nr:APC family permease [Fimbriimonadaceae bacterium]